MGSEKSIFMYVSLWDHNAEKTKGLAIYRFDAQSGAITHLKTVNEDIAYNMSYIDSEKGLMYINNETEHVPDVPYTSGRIFGYELDRDTGDVKEAFRTCTGCPSPDYLAIDETGKYLVTSHHSCPERVTKLVQGKDGKWQPIPVFNDSALMLFALKKDGSIGELLDVKNHKLEGYGFDEKGQAHICHPHSCLKAPLYHNLFCVPDKGDGNVYMYTIDEEKQTLVMCDCQLSDIVGSKARYCSFHPTKPFVFINHENLSDGDMHVSAFRYDADGKLNQIGIYKGLEAPADLSKINSQQGMCISPDGKYLYSICRNPAIVIVFEIDQETGALRMIQNAKVEGEFPRGIAISPDGRFVVTSCLFTADLAVYSVGMDGKLTPTGYSDRLLGGSYINFFCP